MTRAEFDTLADEYEKATGHLSFTRQMAKTPEFTRLLSAGMDIVPWILKDFPSGKRWGMEWILVLSCITGAVPMWPCMKDGWAKWDVDATCKAWVKWGETKYGRYVRIHKSD